MFGDTTLTPSDVPSWTDFVTNFDGTYKQFYDNYNALMSLGPYIQTSHPELLSQYSDMLQQGAVNADKLEQLKATRDTVAAWLQWIGQGAINTFDWFKAQVGLSGLAATPALYPSQIQALRDTTLTNEAQTIRDIYNRGGSSRQGKVLITTRAKHHIREKRSYTPQEAAAYRAGLQRDIERRHVTSTMETPYGYDVGPTTSNPNARRSRARGSYSQRNAANSDAYLTSVSTMSGYSVEDTGLGIVPVVVAIVGIGAATAALILIAQWVSQAYIFAQRLNALQAQEAKGATPAQAAAIVNSTLGVPASNEFLGIPWSLLAWAGVAVILGPPILKMLGEKR